MKKVLHYVGIMNRGGMETFIMNLYRNIDKNNIQFDFAVHTTEKGDFDDEILTLGGKIYSFPAYRKAPLKYRKAWRDFFSNYKNEYTAFHFHTNSLANIVALEEAAKANIPIRIVHSHSSYANKGKLQILNNVLHNTHQKKLKNIATNLLACSSEAADWLFGGDTLDNIKIQFIKNGINCAEFSYDSSVANNKKRELNLDNKIVVGHIGKFVTVKNHRFILQIISEMVKQNQSVVCLLIGDGELLEQIRILGKKLNIENNLVFLGVRKDISELFMCMDLFIMPSLYEGLPVSLIEVQASGVPALISDTISKEVKINSNVHFNSLNKSAEDWAKVAFEVMSKGRITDNKAIYAAGYDAKSTALKYTEIIGGGN